MEVEIKGKITADPRSRVLALEAFTRSLCEQLNLDPAEGAMMLLTAAVHMTHTYVPGKSTADITLKLAETLGYATVAADEFFKLRRVDGARTTQTSR